MKKHSGTLKVDLAYEESMKRDIADVTAIANYSHTDWQRFDTKDSQGHNIPRFTCFYTDDLVKLSETFQTYGVSFCIADIDD